MTKAHEETWTVLADWADQETKARFGPWHVVNERKQAIGTFGDGCSNPDRAKLVAQAPALARALRALCLRFDEQGNDGGESMGQELREQVDDVLAAAGVDAPKMATWRTSDAKPPQPVNLELLHP